MSEIKHPTGIHDMDGYYKASAAIMGEPKQQVCVACDKMGWKTIGELNEVDGVSYCRGHANLAIMRRSYVDLLRDSCRRGFIKMARDAMADKIHRGKPVPKRLAEIAQWETKPLDPS